MVELAGNFFTVKEIAGLMGVTPVAINYHIKRGALKTTMIGHTYIVNEQDYERFKDRELARIKGRASGALATEPQRRGARVGRRRRPFDRRL